MSIKLVAQAAVSRTQFLLQEFAEATASLAAAATKGAFGESSCSEGAEGKGEPGALERIMDVLTTDR